jgi:hypothetical protein
MPTVANPSAAPPAECLPCRYLWPPASRAPHHSTPNRDRRAPRAAASSPAGPSHLGRLPASSSRAHAGGRAGVRPHRAVLFTPFRHRAGRARSLLGPPAAPGPPGRPQGQRAPRQFLRLAASPPKCLPYDMHGGGPWNARTLRARSRRALPANRCRHARTPLPVQRPRFSRPQRITASSMPQPHLLITLNPCVVTQRPCAAFRQRGMTTHGTQQVIQQAHWRTTWPS